MWQTFFTDRHMAWDILISPRWHKILRDFWLNKARLGLAIISICVGVFALGTVLAEKQVLLKNIYSQYNAAAAATASIKIINFDDGLVKHTRKLPGVAEADAIRTVEMRVYLPPSKNRGSDDYEWRTLQLIAIDNFDDIRLNRTHLEGGVWPPSKNSIVLERSSMKITGTNLGDTIQVETMNGLQRDIPIVGIVKDVTVLPGEITGNIAGYISFDTLNWLDEPEKYNKLLIKVTGDERNKVYVDGVISQIRERLTLDGWTVAATNVPQYPGRPVIENTFKTMILIISMVGWMLVGISCIMVANTMDAMLTHEIKQIGIMRIVGGQLNQVVGIYVIFTTIMAGLAALLAVPLSIIASQYLCRLIAGLINYDIFDSQAPLWVFILEVSLALLIAFLASIKPILSATIFTTVREAVNPYGTETGEKSTFLDNWLGKLRGFASPIMLSLRNTFRKKWRLGLTLLTLSLGGGIFIAVFCLRSSLLFTAYSLQNQFSRYDLLVTLNQPYHIDVIKPIILESPGIKNVEGWRSTYVSRVRKNGSKSDPISIIAAPKNTNLMKPEVMQGRWLVPQDEMAVVVNQYIFDREPDLHLGSDMILEFNDQDIKFRIVGVVRGAAGIGQIPIIYVNYEPFSQATHTVNMVDSIEINTISNDTVFIEETAKNLQSNLLFNGFRVSDIQTSAEDLYLLEQRIGILTKVLITLSMLLAIVGGISLAGTMGINVIERTREIGVMRAVGASSTDLIQVTTTESIIIGWLSWIFASVIAQPFGRAASYQLGMAFLNSPLIFSYSREGCLGWFAIVTIIAIIASIMPAQNAMHITVREAISYE